MAKSLAHRSFPRAILTCLAICAAAAPVYAQSYYGSLRGSIVDPNGGAIAAAKVTLTNEGTGAPRSAISNNAGEFVFSEVVPATYSVSVESPGFKKFDRKGVVVGTQQQVSADVKLEVGEVTESVEVTESAPLIEAATASQGQVLDNQKLSDLPNLGRNPFMMSKVAANVIPVGNPAYNRMEDQSGSSSISIAGGPVRGNNYLIDGVPITDSANRAIIIPSLEAVQEVKVQANTYDAEMARTGGGMFNTLMKSGANDFHGSLYGHLRRTSWDANSFFNNAAGVPITDQPNDTWAASFGGPVWIPKLYNGKNRTFFYLGYEHYDDIQSASSVFAAPTAAQRVGDFSGTGSPIIYNPLSGATRSPFPGNVIPQSMLNPAGLAIASTYEMPQFTPASYGAIDITGSGRLPARAAQYTGKLDEDIRSWWRASLSYLRYFSLEPGNTWFRSLSTPDGWRLQRRVDTTQLNNLITINPTTVLTVRYGFNRFPNYSYDVSQGYNLGGLGFAPSFVSQIPVAKAQFPPISMTNLYSLGVQDNNSFVDLASNNFGANVAKYIGRHSLKIGFDYRKIKAAGNDFNDAGGNYSFNGIFTKSAPLSSGTGGADLADLLLGYPSSGNIYTSTKLYEFSNYYGAYIQDDFRVTAKLTLNLGLRWEHESGLQENNNGIVVNFDGSAPNVLASNVTGLAPRGAIVYATDAHPGAGNPYSNKWGPRFGVAYQLNSKTVLRGGFGVFFAPQYALGGPQATVGYNQTTTYIASTNNNVTPDHSLTNPFPGGIFQPVGNSLGAATGLGQSFTIVDPNAKSPYVEQFSLDVQRELPFGLAAEVGFVGSKSSHLSLGSTNLNGNALNPALLSMGTGLTQQVANPFYGNGGVGVIGTPKVQASQLLLPYPTYGAINLQFNDNNKAVYDSMVMKLQKRLSNGLTLLSSLTWSRTWDESGGGVGNTLNSGAKGPQNPYNLAAEYAFSNIDSPWRWSTSFSYQLPFGEGKSFLTNGKLVNYLAGGWSINGVSIFQTGFPLQISQATNYNASFGYASQRPNATGVSPVTTGSLEQRLRGYINPAAFSLAPQFTFGNVGRTIDMRGPGQVNWDLSVFKDVLIREKLRAQFRCEALNAMNTPLFYGPNVIFGSSNFGKITSQANFSRQLQLGLRFSF
ncbi:MAG: TonB-dependent receptor [Acidobacteriota bacterium]|nr:TonB-dependent receptor [Acidobacteriota bacterium]